MRNVNEAEIKKVPEIKPLGALPQFTSAGASNLLAYAYYTTNPAKVNSQTQKKEKRKMFNIDLDNNGRTKTANLLFGRFASVFQTNSGRICSPRRARARQSGIFSNSATSECGLPRGSSCRIGTK